MLILALSVFSCDKDDDSNSCPTAFVGEVVIKNQEELDRFFKCKYKIIEGRLTLFGVNDISALKNLEQVNEIRISNTKLITLEGLNNLKVLKGEIMIIGNSELISLDGLSSLVEIPALNVRGNSKLYDFCELSGDLVNNTSYVVSGNNFNPSRDDLINETVCKSEINIGEKVYDGNVSILPYHTSNRNGRYQSVEDFAKLGYTKIDGSLEIALWGSLESLSGLKEITGDLKLGYYHYEDGSQFVWGNAFENLKGLEALKTIGGTFQLIGSNNLKNLDELINLEYLGGINISVNPLLENIDGLINVTSALNKDIILYGNRILKNINGLSNAKITSLNTLEFGYLDNLSDLNVLSNLTSLNALSINYLNNESLSKMEFLGNLKELNALKIKSANHIKNLDWLTITSTSLNYLILEKNNVLDNLDALSTITEVKGKVAILNNSSLLNLTGLGAIQNIEGDFFIKNNSSLIHLTGIETLTTISGDVAIEENNSLVDLEGLNGLKQIEGTFNIYENKSLLTLVGLNNLERVDKSFLIGLHLVPDNICDCLLLFRSTCKACQSIQDISALSNLNYVGETLWLFNSDVQNLDGLQNLTSVNSLRIENNAELMSLEGFPKSSININRISIEDNINLISLTGLEFVTHLENLNIAGNSVLSDTNLNVFKNLESITGQLILSDLPVLKTFEGLENLNTIGDGIGISKNPELLNIEGLKNAVIKNDIWVNDNNLLTSLNGLESVSTELNRLSIKNNSALTNLDALKGIEFIKQYFFIENNPLITNLDAFSNVKSVYKLRIIDNNSLVSFCGLKNADLPSGSSFSISGNAYNPTSVQIKSDDGCSN